MDVRIVSIGTLAANPFWSESSPVRTGHATCTLIRTGDRVILVDPGLPSPALRAKLFERSGLEPEAITHVFLTSFRPDVFRGIELTPRATWWVAQDEREGVGVPLAQQLRRAADEGDTDTAQALERDVALLSRCEPAPDELGEGVSLFPLPGVTPGLCGVLIAAPRHTLVIAGDSVPTVEHLEHGRIPDRHADRERALDSLREVVEIADLVIPGRDGLCVNPTRRPF